MAKTPSQPGARGKSKPAKAAPAKSAASRAKRPPPGDELAPDLKKSRAKTARAASRPAGVQGRRRPHSASLGAGFEEKAIAS